MRALHRQTPWLAFGVAAVAAWAQGTYGWGTSWYQQGTWLAAVVSLFAASWVLESARWAWKSVLLVVLVLLVANYTVVEGLAMLAIWSVGEFAP